MKKIITLLIFLFVFVGVTYGQATWTKYNKVEGRNNQHVKGDTSATNVKVMGSIDLPTGASTSAKQDTLIARWNSWLASDWATKTLQQNIRDTLKLKFDTLIAKDFAVSTKQDTMIARWNTWLASDWATATLQGAIRDSIVVKINATNLALVEMNNGIDSLDAVNTRSEVLLTDIKSSLTSYARYFGAINNDTTSATDTVTFGSATSWAKFTLDAVADTLEWSLDGTNWHSLLPVQSFTTPEKLNITYFSEIYIKPRNVGTITYSYVWIAY